MFGKLYCHLKRKPLMVVMIIIQALSLIAQLSLSAHSTRTWRYPPEPPRRTTYWQCKWVSVQQELHVCSRNALTFGRITGSL